MIICFSLQSHELLFRTTLLVNFLTIVLLRTTTVSLRRPFLNRQTNICNLISQPAPFTENLFKVIQ